MEERQYKLADIIIKGFGFIATAISIYWGIVNFNKQQIAASELEFNRNFWRKQTEVYSEVCKNAGSIIANIDDSIRYEEEKRIFLSLYYGEMILVEDSSVEKAMRELKSYIEIVRTDDSNMVIKLKRKVIKLSEACRESAAYYKARITE